MLNKKDTRSAAARYALSECTITVLAHPFSLLHGHGQLPAELSRQA